MFEEQLADGRDWLFDTVEPGLGDIAAYTVYGWAYRFRGVRAVFSSDKFPMASKVNIYTNISHAVLTLFQWMDRMAAFVKSKREANEPVITKIDGMAAAKIIADSQHSVSPSVEFDTDEAERLGLRQGQEVEVVPDDNGQCRNQVLQQLLNAV